MWFYLRRSGLMRFVEVRTQSGGAGLGIGQWVPDDDQEGPADHDDGPFLTAEAVVRCPTDVLLTWTPELDMATIVLTAQCEYASVAIISMG